MIAYAGWILDNEIRAQSSSGGLFSALSKLAFSKNGAVYCVVEENCRLRYIKAESENDIVPARGSKYYQARTDEINIEELCAEVNSGRIVIFFGITCHVGMIRNILNIKFGCIPDNMILVDILCHGVVSGRLIEKYRAEFEKKKKKKIEQHNFRSKKAGRVGSQYSRYYFEDGDVLDVNNQDDYYMRMYFRDLLFRPSCYNCIYPGYIRPSDITIGDFNGIKNILKSFPDDTTVVSSIVCNTDKGEKLINMLVESGVIGVVPSTVEVIGSQNLPLIKKVEKPFGRKISLKLVKQIGVINTSKVISIKYYIKKAFLLVLGENTLNKIKRKLGRVVIEN